MSTFAVTAEQLTVLPHSNADALELAQVGLYRAVVPKGVYKTGDWAIYIPEQAILPDALIAELGLVGRLAGPGKNRVKAIRLRGELSQGIVCLPLSLKDHDLEAAGHGVDFAEYLGIVKWAPPVPVHMAGDVVAAPGLLPWIDIENIKRHPTVFQPGERVQVTEKVHGTCCLVTVNFNTSSAGYDLMVTSKGLGQKNLALVESPTNLYWRAVRGHQLDDAAHALANLFEADRLGLFGEVYGPGVQDLGYGYDATAQVPGFALFDICVHHDGGTVEWLAPEEIAEALAYLSNTLGITAPPLAPILYDGPFDLDTVLELTKGRETVSGMSAHIREGVVIRSVPRRHSDDLGGPAILKAISDAYLTRKDGTEFE